MKTPKKLRDLVITFALLYAGVVAGLWAFQDRILYPGVTTPLPHWIAQSMPSSVERVTIPVADGVNLAALYRRPDPGQPTVIVFHGNGGYPEDYGFLYKSWTASGYGIVAPVYRGFPRSGGTVDAAGILGDALSVYDWTVRREPSSRVIAFGQSLGSASAVKVSANRDVAGTILVSPFKSMLSVVQDKFPFLPISFTLNSQYRNDLEMPKIKTPIIVFHGEMDTLVPLSSGEALAALAPTKPRFVVVKGAGHIDGLFGGAMVRAINRFISENGRVHP